jgi:hypothetical protein
MKDELPHFLHPHYEAQVARSAVMARRGRGGHMRYEIKHFPDRQRPYRLCDGDGDVFAAFDTREEAIAVRSIVEDALPHMCRMDHQEIRHGGGDDDERCPLCRVLDENARLRSEVAQLRAENKELWDDRWEAFEEERLAELKVQGG